MGWSSDPHVVGATRGSVIDSEADCRGPESRACHDQQRARDGIALAPRLPFRERMALETEGRGALRGVEFQQGAGMHPRTANHLVHRHTRNDIAVSGHRRAGRSHALRARGHDPRGRSHGRGASLRHDGHQHQDHEKVLAHRVLHARDELLRLKPSQRTSFNQQFSLHLQL